MIANKKEFLGGIGLLIAFLVALGLIFSPIFGGKNGLDYADSLYNSISKGSAYYIPKMKKESEKFMGDSVSVNLAMIDEAQAQQTALLFSKAGAIVNTSGAQVKVSGDLGKILENCLTDADNMFANDGQKLSDKYGYDGKRVLFNWWKAFKAMEKNLNKQENFNEAMVISNVSQKTVEAAYNYYGVISEKMTQRMGLVTFSLSFYVFYTLWYGFAIMFIFEGWGLKMGR
jgi:hypothetical protein